MNDNIDIPVEVTFHLFYNRQESHTFASHKEYMDWKEAGSWRLPSYDGYVELVPGKIVKIVVRAVQ